MGNRNQSAVRSSCGDWVPPTELQQLWQSQPKIVRQPDKQKLLESIIEKDVIPRLLLANRRELAMTSPLSNQMAAKLAERVDEFAELVVRAEVQDSVGYFDGLRTEGASIESLFQDLLAPTALRLGVLWDEDINSFMDVTRGIGHLQHIVRMFSDEFCEERRRPLNVKRTLLMPLPGEQHTFGLSLLREHCLREGWRVWCGPPDTIEDVVKLAHEQWFDMIGLSSSALGNAKQLAKDIRRMRQTSVNPQLQIFVGGHAFLRQPELVAEVGADATAANGRQLVLAINQVAQV